MKKKGFTTIIMLFMVLLFTGCGEEAVLQYKALYGGTTCIIVGIDNKEADSVVIPEVINGMMVTQIEMRAFADCAKLKSVELPNTLESIGIGAFCGCVSLETIALPDGIKEIPTAAFLNCTSLKKVEFSKGLEVIDVKAFSGCTSLETVELPESIVTLAEEAFSDCTSLSSVVFPKEMQTIEKSVFENCTSLEKIVFPENLEKIRKSAFACCSSIKNLDFPGTLKGIGDNAFKDCTRLSALEISERMLIGYGEAFSGCYNLKSIKVSDNNPDYTSKDSNGNETDTVMTEVIYYSQNVQKSKTVLCLTGKSFEIPDGVEWLAKHLYEDTDLKSLKVPASILPECLDDILKYNPNLATIYGVAGSDAETWAKSRKLEFIER